MAAITIPGMFLTGNHASRPSSGVGVGTLYSCTTHSLIYQTTDTGSTWVTWATLTGTGLSDPMTTRGDVIIRNASNVTARLGIGSSGKVLSSDGTDISWQSPTSSSPLLGVNAYNPGTDAAYTTTSATLVDADATNMAVTFTAPASTNVLVRLTATVEPSTSGASQFNYQSWGVRESASIILGPSVVARDMTGNATAWLLSVSAVFKITGISGGSHTYKWGFAAPGGASTKLHAGGIFGQAVMEVWAL